MAFHDSKPGVKLFVHMQHLSFKCLYLTVMTPCRW